MCLNIVCSTADFHSLVYDTSREKETAVLEPCSAVVPGCQSFREPALSIAWGAAAQLPDDAGRRAVRAAAKTPPSMRQPPGEGAAGSLSLEPEFRRGHGSRWDALHPPARWMTAAGSCSRRCWGRWWTSRRPGLEPNRRRGPAGSSARALSQVRRRRTPAGSGKLLHPAERRVRGAAVDATTYCKPTHQCFPWPPRAHPPRPATAELPGETHPRLRVPAARRHRAPPRHLRARDASTSGAPCSPRAPFQTIAQVEARVSAALPPAQCAAFQ